MIGKLEKEIVRVLDLMAKEKEADKLREYALVVESLVMSFNRLKA